MYSINTAFRIAGAFIKGVATRATKSRKDCIREDKATRNKLREEQLDAILARTMDASDPVAFY